MRLRLAGGLDLATGALILGGAVLIAGAILGATIVLTPPPTPDVSESVASPQAAPLQSGRPAVALPSDRVAAVLYVEAVAGAGAAARAGDRVDVLGYFSHQGSGAQNVTRLLAQDVAVLSADRTGGNVALTLAVTQDASLLLQEAQVLGARTFVTLRPPGSSDASRPPTNFSDADLAARLAGKP